LETQKKEARRSTFDIVVRETDSALSQHWPRMCGINNFQKEQFLESARGSARLTLAAGVVQL